MRWHNAHHNCRLNGIVLSVDNYVPADHNMFYNRTEQGIVADYIAFIVIEKEPGRRNGGQPLRLRYSLQYVIVGLRIGHLMPCHVNGIVLREIGIQSPLLLGCKGKSASVYHAYGTYHRPGRQQRLYGCKGIIVRFLRLLPLGSQIFIADVTDKAVLCPNPGPALGRFLLRQHIKHILFCRIR